MAQVEGTYSIAWFVSYYLLLLLLLLFVLGTLISLKSSLSNAPSLPFCRSVTSKLHSVIRQLPLNEACSVPKTLVLCAWVLLCPTRHYMLGQREGSPGTIWFSFQARSELFKVSVFSCGHCHALWAVSGKKSPLYCCTVS